MQRPFLDLWEARGKMVESLRVYANPPSGREVHIEFSDGTALSIEMNVRSAVNSKYYRNKQGDIEIIEERQDPPVDI